MYALAEGHEWEASGSDWRVVEIQILDVLFNNAVCSLLYMRDITSFLRQDEL